MIAEEEFRKIFSEAGLQASVGLYAPLRVYSDMLADWGMRMNLTAIREDRAVAVKHFADSLIPLTFVEIPAGSTVVDVGSGAGFPGVPMKLARPDLSLTLLDSQQKRLTFLEALCRKLDIEAGLLHMRAEEAGRAPEYREHYDAAVSRAVAALPVLTEYCLPLVRTGGMMLALKGASGRAEAAESERAVTLCGGRIESITDYRLPDGDARALIVIRKISQTSTQYPRTAAKIGKNPL